MNIEFYLEYRVLRERDVTKFQLQFCVALLLMLLVFLTGTGRNENEIVCTAMSCLLQYFVLATVFWMFAQAVLMFRKLVLVFSMISNRFVILMSLGCWCKFFVQM